MRASTATIEERIRRLDLEIQQALSLKRKLEAKLRERKVLETLSSNGEKTSRRTKAYLIARQYILHLIQRSGPNGISPMEINDEFRKSSYDIPASTLRSYLTRMKREGYIRNSSGRWMQLVIVTSVDRPTEPA